MRLRLRAAQRGHSMEEEARNILSTALSQPDPPMATNLADRIRQRFAPVGGVDLKIPRRGWMRKPIDFGSPKHDEK